MRKTITLRLLRIALAITLTGLLACGGDPSPGPGSDPDPGPNPDPKPSVSGGKLIQSNQPRQTAAAPSADLEKLVEGNTAFAWSLYRQLAVAKGNLFCSPLSISQALSMTYAGARGKTEQQMAETLHFALPQQQLHAAANSLDLALAQRGSGAKGMDGKGFRLHVVNAIWGQDGYGFMQPFLDVLAQYYGAGLRALDFHNAPEPSRLIINEWVAQQTEDKIRDLLGPGDIMDITRLVLTNAIYFNAAWDQVFPEELTRPERFNLEGGGTVTVPTMSRSDSMAYASGDGYQAVELPYDGGELSMLVVVPEAGRFAEVESAASTVTSQALATLTSRQVALSLPKWKVEMKVRLRDALKAMGMTEAFDGARANFTAINGGTEPLWIDNVIHQAYVDVNEKGTEAAAATAVVMVGGAMPSTPVVLKVDRPFIFVIRDIPTGTILFVGRVVNPLG